MPADNRTQQQAVGSLRGRVSRLGDKARAQSDTIGVLLVVGVVLVLAASLAIFILADFGSEEEPGLVDLQVEVNGEAVTISHSSGDSLQSEDINVIIESGGDRVEKELLQFTETPSEPQRFVSGDTFSERGAGAPYVGDVTVTVVYEPTNSVLTEESFEVNPDLVVTIDDVSDSNGGALSVGDDVQVTYTLDNQGAPETQNVDVLFDGSSVNSTTLNVPAGNSKTVTVTQSANNLQNGLDLEVDADDGSAVRNYNGPSVGVNLQQVNVNGLGTNDVSTMSTADVTYEISNDGDIGVNRTVTVESRSGNGTNIDTVNSIKEVAGDETLSNTVTLNVVQGGEIGLSFGSASDGLQIGADDFQVTDLNVASNVAEGDVLSVDYTVENQGNFNGTQDINFFIDNVGEGTDGPVKLTPGETVSGSFSYDTTGDGGSTLNVEVSTGNDTASQDVTVGAGPPAEFTVTSLSAPSQIAVGQTRNVDYTIENTGSGSGTQAIEFLVNGTQENSTTETLNPGDTSSGSFPFSAAAGKDGASLTVTVQTANDSQSDTVGVTSSPSPLFSVTDLSAPSEVTAGDQFTANYTVENTGTQSGTQSIDFLVDGVQEDSVTETLDAGNTTSGQFTYTTGSGDSDTTLTVEVSTDNDTQSTTVDVLPDADLRAALSDASGQVGDTIQVTLDVTSIIGTGDEFGSYTIVTSYDNSVLNFTGVVDGQWSPFGVNEPTADSVALTSFSASGSTPAEPALTYEFEVVGSGTANVVFNNSEPGGAGTNEINDGNGVAYSLAFDNATVTGQVADPAPDFQVTNFAVTSDVTEGESFSVDYTVENTGTAQGTQDIQFLVDGTQDDSVTETLSAGDNTTGSFSYATGANSGGSTLNVSVSTENDTRSANVNVKSGPAFFNVSSVSAPSQATASDRVTVDYTLENIGGSQGTQNVELLVDGTQENSTSQTLTEGEVITDSLSFFTSSGDAGTTLTVEISTENDSQSDTVDVIPSSVPFFDVTSIDAPSEVSPGENVTVDYTLENTGDVQGTQDVQFLVDGTQENSTSQTLTSGETFSGSFEFDTSGRAGDTLSMEVSTDNDSQSTDVLVAYDLVASLSSETATGTVDVHLNVTSFDGNGGDNISAYSFGLRYNESVLEFNSVSQNQLGGALFGPSEPTSDSVTLSAVSTTGDRTGVTPLEPALTFTFDIIGPGTSDIQFDNSISGFAGNEIVNSDTGKAYATQFKDGTVDQ